MDILDTRNTPDASHTVVWVHGDALGPRNPALLAYPGAPAIYVWDDALLAQYGLSLKRVTFLYECLLELPVTIRRGDDVAAEILRFAAEHDAARVVTSETPAPRFAAISEAIAAHLPVETLPVEPFVRYRGKIELKRFSRYWRVAQRYAYGDDDGR